MSEVDLIGVEGEDLALRVAPLDLDGDEPLLHFPLGSFQSRADEHAAAHVIAKEEVAGESAG
jgi:hypothetical protein